MGITLNLSLMNAVLTFVGANDTDYKVQSTTRIFRYEGHFITPKRLVCGNGKLHKMFVFDLPAVKTCLNCKDCKATCYAMQAQIQYPNTRVFRETNLHLFLNNREILSNLIKMQLSRARTTVVRLHGSGEFFSQDYIEFWADIISQFPEIRFYVYTKVEQILDFSNINSLNNFNLISSFIDCNLNYGSLTYCQMLQNKYNAFICPCGINNDIQCGIDCKYCITNKNVCFLIH
jgi:hypothetical protein